MAKYHFETLNDIERYVERWFSQERELNPDNFSFEAGNRKVYGDVAILTFDTDAQGKALACAFKQQVKNNPWTAFFPKEEHTPLMFMAQEVTGCEKRDMFPIRTISSDSSFGAYNEYLNFINIEHNLRFREKFVRGWTVNHEHLFIEVYIEAQDEYVGFFISKDDKKGLSYLGRRLREVNDYNFDVNNVKQTASGELFSDSFLQRYR